MDTQSDLDAAPPARGRPRDPDLEERVFDAAMAVYGRSGWQGFTLDAIARAAAVGKNALYRRWKDRAELLRQTLEARWEMLGAIDTGSLAGDLAALAEAYFDMLAGPNGDVLLHSRADNWKNQEVREATRSYGETVMLRTRAIVSRAVERGELPAGTSAALVIDVIIGAITNRFATTPPELRETMIGQRNRIIAELVSLVQRGAAPA